MISFLMRFTGHKRNILFLSLSVGLSLCFITSAFAAANELSIQKGIAQEVLRLHVLAHSDSDEEQALKLLVRDAVVEAYGEALSKANNKEESIHYLSERLNEIESLCMAVVRMNGSEHIVTASIENTLFPDRYYDDIFLPAGYYDALIIRIGDALGKNWWCCMFPPLCFVDGTYRGGDAFSKVLSKEELKVVTDKKIHIKFKLVELLKGMME